MGALSLLAPLLLGAATPAGTIRVELPPRSPCAYEEVASALRARLPGAEIVPGDLPEPGEVRLRLSSDEGQWRIDLGAPGQPPLTRRFAAPDCLGLSGAESSIAERYLQSIAWTAAPGEVRALPPPPPPPRWQASLAVGGGAGLGGLTGPAPVGQLELGARLGGWLLELWAAYLGSGQLPLVTPTRPAYLFHHGAAAALAVGHRLALGPGAVRLALAPGVSLYWVGSSPATPGTTPDPLPHRQLVTGALPSLGLQAGYELNVLERLSLGLRLQARLHLGTATFAAEGYTPSLATHLLEGEACLTVGYLFF